MLLYLTTYVFPFTVLGQTAVVFWGTNHSLFFLRTSSPERVRSLPLSERSPMVQWGKGGVLVPRAHLTTPTPTANRLVFTWQEKQMPCLLSLASSLFIYRYTMPFFFRFVHCFSFLFFAVYVSMYMISRCFSRLSGKNRPREGIERQVDGPGRGQGQDQGVRGQA